MEPLAIETRVVEWLVRGCEAASTVRTVLLSPDGALLLAGGVSGALVGWRLDDGALACTFDSAGAAVSCACISGHEMLVGTQEGEVVGYALDPAVLYGRSVRDVAAWA
eukprot:scaffold42366_cov74-Phaeocystis_antarctica.AAC.1